LQEAQRCPASILVRTLWEGGLDGASTASVQTAFAGPPIYEMSSKDYPHSDVNNLDAYKDLYDRINGHLLQMNYPAINNDNASQHSIQNRDYIEWGAVNQTLA
jgi:hypothetical protein